MVVFLFLHIVAGFESVGITSSFGITIMEQLQELVPILVLKKSSLAGGLGNKRCDESCQCPPSSSICSSTILQMPWWFSFVVMIYQPEKKLALVLPMEEDMMSLHLVQDCFDLVGHAGTAGMARSQETEKNRFGSKKRNKGSRPYCYWRWQHVDSSFKHCVFELQVFKIEQG